MDKAVFLEKAAAVERHLQRIAEMLPASAEDFKPMTAESDAVILHLWQATQIVIDLAVSRSVDLGLGVPRSYGDAFTRLVAHQVLESSLGDRMKKAAGFRNVVAHNYEAIDLKRVFEAAQNGPKDLQASVRAIANTW